MKGILRFLWIALALAGKVAARDTRGINTPSRLLLVNDGQSKTDAAMDAVCTQGLPASAQHPDSDYPIDNYTVVTPAQHWSSYTLRQDWYDEHYLSGPHYMPFTHASDPYGAFKCQYTCNAAENCNSYFVWYEKVGTPDEHLSCVLFDAIITPSIFVEAEGTIATGAYDRLCDQQ
ncbi:hypothetical protein N656DRAFT_843564 [Canariomyces notabilis]|uniref:Apple domain-containing protein n=1 Tax=Canariomyces notabilis TaxID=2074819 RepID=A0AAN6TI48_9PEZI|nr:hypothetical protein N656DRAFT_843564 [Canariomyces arenarius]